MAYRTLEINLLSASNIKDVNFITKMDVYAVVYVSGDLSQSPNQQKIRTPIDKGCGSNPRWNFPMKFTIQESLAQQNRLTVVFRLRSERAFGDRDIGEVNVPVKELLDSPAAAATGGDDKSMKSVSYQVRKPSGKPKGLLEFSYKIGEKFDIQIPQIPKIPQNDYAEPVTAYPAPMAAAGSSSGVPYGGGYQYPPLQQGGYQYPPPPQVGYAGYPLPAQPGYGYQPQPQPGYGYPGQGGPYGYPPPPMMQQAVKPKKNKMGGMGMGLGAGLLGGLLIGDMMTDVAVADAMDYDGGCDGGFDGGFDF